MNVTKTLTLAVAAVLASGVVVAGTAFAGAAADVSPSDYDEQLTDDGSTDAQLPDDYALDVIDPDDKLSDDDVERAIELAWAAEDVRAEFESSDPAEITVQATGGLDEVLVVLHGENGEAASTDVDLEAGTVTDVLPSEQVSTADSHETVTVTEVTEAGSTITFETTDGDADVFTISTDEIDDGIQQIELRPADESADGDDSRNESDGS